MTYIIAYIGAGLAFLALDLIWLGVIAKGFYNSQLGDLRGETQIGPAVAFYLIYLFGVVWLAIRPGLDASSWDTVVVNGAIVGLTAYATYNFTNLATTRNWPTELALVDTIWGTVLTTTAAFAGYVAVRLLS